MAASGDLFGTVETLARRGPDLSVTANLSVTVNDIDLAVSTVEDRIRIQVPSVWAGVRLLRSERDRFPRLSEVLSEADLTAEIRVGSAVIAIAGSDAVPGRLSRQLGLGPLEVRLWAILPAILRFR